MLVLVAGDGEVRSCFGLRLDEAPEEGEAEALESVEVRRDDATHTQLTLVHEARVEVEACKQHGKYNFHTYTSLQQQLSLRVTLNIQRRSRRASLMARQQRSRFHLPVEGVGGVLYQAAHVGLEVSVAEAAIPREGGDRAAVAITTATKSR